MGKLWKEIKYIFTGIAVLADEEQRADHELWDDPKRKARIRRKQARERRRHGR